MSPVAALVFEEGRLIEKQQCRIMSPEERAWQAASIDFDGGIYVSGNRAITMGLTSRDSPLTEYARKITGIGKITKVGRQFCWQPNVKGMISILEQITPYLIIKRELAETVLWYKRTMRQKNYFRYSIEDKENWVKVLSLRRSNFKPESLKRRELTGPVSKLNTLERVWLAAAIDFDGDISISGFQPILGVTNVSSKVLNYIIELTNVGVAEHQRWKVSKLADIYELLVQITPYLVCKRKLAEAVINYLEVRLPRKGCIITSEDKKLWKLVEANRRGG